MVDAVTGAPLGIFQENRFMTDCTLNFVCLSLAILPETLELLLNYSTYSLLLDDFVDCKLKCELERRELSL